jgi:hypothetical protein
LTWAGAAMTRRSPTNTVITPGWSSSWATTWHTSTALGSWQRSRSSTTTTNRGCSLAAQACWTPARASSISSPSCAATWDMDPVAAADRGPSTDAATAATLLCTRGHRKLSAQTTTNQPATLAPSAACTLATSVTDGPISPWARK